ncbi:MAG TPA: methionyl-tRNA formyltransferase [Bacillota bacterium]|nr:methionyl-tRNA formyltransferase [Bacillota bacterium]
MRIVFMGTPDFAVPPLNALCESHDVVAVVTKTDKPRGRGNKTVFSPVKAQAIENGIEVLQPETLRNEAIWEKLRSYEADLFVVAAYGKLLLPEVLEIPLFGCINIHASLLPKYRGAAPINRAIMNGDTVGGLSIMYMAQGLDTGDVILQRSFDISKMNAGEYHNALSREGCSAVLEAIEQIKNGTVHAVKQDDSAATYAAKIEKSEMMLDFSLPARSVINKIRGLSPYPCAYFMLDDRRIKVLEAAYADAAVTEQKMTSVGKNGITVMCCDGAITITRMIPEGSTAMDAAAFYAGYKGQKGC